MKKCLAILAVILTVAQTFIPISGQATNRPGHDSQKQNDSIKNEKEPSPAAASVFPENASDRNNEAEAKGSSHHYQVAAINISGFAAVPEPWTWHDKASWVANMILALGGLAGIWIAVSTLRKVERQTKTSWIAAKASLKQAKHMVESDRPFLVIDARGPKGTEFWMRNCGKSPAQIIFLDPALRYEFPEFIRKASDWAMPYPPHYGVYYDDPKMEQINVPWLAAGEERRFAGFDASILDSLSAEMRQEINGGNRVIRIYSAIKYRGMFSRNVFESRFCYGWSKANGTHLAGPYGYNHYT